MTTMEQNLASILQSRAHACKRYLLAKACVYCQLYLKGSGCWTHRNTKWLRTENKVYTSFITPCSFFPTVFPFQVSFPSNSLDILLMTSSHVITWQLIFQALAFVHCGYISFSPHGQTLHFASSLTTISLKYPF